MGQRVPHHGEVARQQPVQHIQPGSARHRPRPGIQPPAAWEPSQQAGEDVQHQQREPEAGDGHAADRHAPQDLIRRLVAEDSGYHAEEYPQHNGDEHGEHRQLHRRGEILKQILQHRPPGADGVAHISLEQVTHIDEILLNQRFVQPPLGLEGGHHLGIVLGRGAQVSAHRVAGHQVGNQEDHQGDTEEQQHHQAESSCNIASQKAAHPFQGI